MDDSVVKAEILKRVILTEYKSIRQFSVEMDIPYSTLVTALERGIGGMAYSTVIRICDALRLNPVDFSPLEEGNNALSAQIRRKKLWTGTLDSIKPDGTEYWRSWMIIFRFRLIQRVQRKKVEENRCSMII